MQGNKFACTYRLDGTLAANKTIVLTFPFAVTLLSASAKASNDSAALLSIGTVADPDGYLTAIAIGDSDVPVTFDKDDWNGALLPAGHIADVDQLHIAKDTAIALLLDYDGASGTAAQNVDITLVFAEG